MDFWLDILLADDIVVVVAIDYEHRPNVDALVKIDLSKMVLCVLDRQRWPERESLPIRTVTLSIRRKGLLIAEKKINKMKSMNFQNFHQASCLLELVEKCSLVRDKDCANTTGNVESNSECIRLRRAVNRMWPIPIISLMVLWPTQILSIPVVCWPLTFRVAAPTTTTMGFPSLFHRCHYQHQVHSMRSCGAVVVALQIL